MARTAEIPNSTSGATLAERLIERIGRQGAITLAEYMAIALTDPDQGYYTSGDPLGADGDFTTAPEISQMFGELIGLWCCEAWQRLGAPEAIHLIELGPGHGTLMADALRAARLQPGFLAAIELHLIEVSRALRSRQEQALRDQAPDRGITWHEHLSEVPEGPALLLANEFFDALPIHSFEQTEAGWRERVVTMDAERGGLTFALAAPYLPAFALLPRALRDAAIGTVAEVSPAAIGLVSDLSTRLARFGGAALIIDFGEADGRGKASLQAVRRHAHHRVLDQPGLADLAARVDFEALAATAREAGAQAYGPLSQAEFLQRLGIDQRAEMLMAGAAPLVAQDIRLALQRLTDPAEMGTLFQILALAGPEAGPPVGFA